MQEEDTESTVSGCSSSMGARFVSETSKEPTPIEIDSVTQDLEAVPNNLNMSRIKGGEHDGHYFIRVGA